MAVLLDAGNRRLRQLADGPTGPGLDPAYRGRGSALFEVADRGAHGRSATLVLCGTLAATLLQASRPARPEVWRLSVAGCCLAPCRRSRGTRRARPATPSW